MALYGRNIFWLALTVCSWTVHAKDCPNTWEAHFSRTYTCDDPTLGTYNYDDPFSGFPLPCCYDDNDVLYALYTRDNPDTYSRLHLSRPLPSDFSARQGTIFVSHGWQNDFDIPNYVDMRKALLHKGDYNVVMLDWPAHKLWYPDSASETRTVGALTSQIMQKVAEEGDVDYQDMWCIGHSLGAHVCGFAARKTPRLIGRVTGLDPAGPWFESEDDLRVGLHYNDASFVDIIHTDTHLYGTLRRLGHMDFYVNGRKRQPNCFDKRSTEKRNIFDRFPGCSHNRVLVLFIESINTDNCFLSRQTCTVPENLPGSCGPCEDAPGGVCAVMGFSAEGSGKNGIYYLETADDFPPHCMG